MTPCAVAWAVQIDQMDQMDGWLCGSHRQAPAVHRAQEAHAAVHQQEQRERAERALGEAAPAGAWRAVALGELEEAERATAERASETAAQRRERIGAAAALQVASDPVFGDLAALMGELGSGSNTDEDEDDCSPAIGDDITDGDSSDDNSSMESF